MQYQDLARFFVRCSKHLLVLFWNDNNWLILHFWNHWLRILINPLRVEGVIAKENWKMVSKIYIFPTTTYYRHDRIAKPSNSPNKILSYSSHNSDKPQNYLKRPAIWKSYHQIHLDTDIVWQLKQLPNGRMTELKNKKQKVKSQIKAIKRILFFQCHFRCTLVAV